MAAPLYYLPGATAEQLSPELLRQVGLADRWADCLDRRSEIRDRVASRTVRARGPDGGSGVLVVAIPPHGKLPTVGCHPDQQTWTEVDSGLWLGIQNDAPPTPADLMRHAPLDGHETILGDHVWQVPIVRRGGIRPALPQALTRKQGRLELRLRREWEPVWEASGRVWNLLTTVQTAEWDEVYQLCRQMLAINYRVDDPELDLLQPIDTDSFQRVFQSVVDWPLVEQILRGELPEDPAAHPTEAATAAA